MLQYLISAQFLAHFLRHSNGRPQRTQILGAKPFLIFAWRVIRYERTTTLCATSSLTDASRIRRAHRVAQMLESRCFRSETRALHTKNWCSYLAMLRA